MALIKDKQERTTELEAVRPQARVRPYTDIFAFVAGITLGMAAPGQSVFMNHWYLAWFCIAPLFAQIFSSQNANGAALRAFLFGAGYNLVWLHWLLFFHPNENCPPLLALFFLTTAICHQGFLFAALGYIAHKMKGLPFITLTFTVPLLWVLILNKTGNSAIALGIPWTQVEYTQWCCNDLLQIASFTGGIGIGALLVLFNLNLFFLLVSFSRWSLKFKNLNKSSALLSFATVCALLCGCLAFGHWRLNQTEVADTKLNTALVQGNISFRAHGAKPEEIFQRYYSLCSSAQKNTLCIWPEIALPIPLKENKTVIDALSSLAKEKSQAWIVGGLDKDNQGRIYNSLYAIDLDGRLGDEVYHKQTLVPFGERMPFGLALFQLLKNAGIDTRGEDYHPGSRSLIFNLAQTKIGSSICLESAQSEFTAKMVRDGAQILTNSSNTTWFAGQDIGKQLTAFGALRAVECGRYFAFVTTVGPSALIDDRGRVRASAPSGEACVLTYEVPIKNEITPFVRWFR